jgi:hypothetical protein
MWESRDCQSAVKCLIVADIGRDGALSSFRQQQLPVLPACSADYAEVQASLWLVAKTLLMPSWGVCSSKFQLIRGCSFSSCRHAAQRCCFREFSLTMSLMYTELFRVHHAQQGPCLTSRLDSWITGYYGCYAVCVSHRRCNRLLNFLIRSRTSCDSGSFLTLSLRQAATGNSDGIGVLV